jgi:hypothetical protein
VKRVALLLLGLAAAGTGAAALADSSPAPDGTSASLRVRHSQQLPSGNRVRLGTSVTLAVKLDPANSLGAIAGVQILLPRGMRMHRSEFPRCRQIRLEQEGPAGCPAGAAVGKGRLSYFLTGAAGGTPSRRSRAPIRAFNGRADTFLLHVDPPEGPAVTMRFNIRARGRLLSFRAPRALVLVPGASQVRYASLRLEIGRQRRGRGARRHFLTNPRACNGGYEWLMRLEMERGKVTLGDVAPCSG